MDTPPNENTHSTPPSFVFSSPEGFALCRAIITARLGYDPHDYQLEGICKSLDGVDLLAVTPTGSGKTGFLVMYMLVMHTLMQTPSRRKLPSHFRKNPAMIVVCPTKSLEQDMEPRFQAAGLSTRVINADSTDKARRSNVDIWAGVADTVHVLLLAPEQLRTKDFEKLVNRNDYQQRVVAIGIDEAHLLDTWGKTFRSAYKSIGPSRMRFMSNPVLIVLTATLREGGPMKSVCGFLGMPPGSFHLIRRSNMRYDIRLLFRTIQSAARGTSFRELNWVLEEKRRVIIFCPTIALSFRVSHYLWRESAGLPNREQRIRMYNALNWPGYNEETLGFMHNDTRSRVTVATDTLSVGIDASQVDDVVLYDFNLPVNSDAIMQKAGRIRNGQGRGSRVVVYVPRDGIDLARHVLGMADSETVSGGGPKRKVPAKKVVDIDESTARLILARCKVEAINSLYANPDNEAPCMCATCEGRPRYSRPQACNCSGCMPEASQEDSDNSGQPADVMASEDTTTLPHPDLAPAAAPPRRSPEEHVTKAMRNHAKLRLRKFQRWLFDSADECMDALLTPECFFPEVLMDVLLDDLYAITDIPSLKVSLVSLKRLDDHWERLYEVVEELRVEFAEMRAEARASKAAKAKETRERNRAAAAEAGRQRQEMEQGKAASVENTDGTDIAISDGQGSAVGDSETTPLGQRLTILVPGRRAGAPEATAIAEGKGRLTIRLPASVGARIGKTA